VGRRRGEWTQAKFERYLKEGRGQGSGENYRPWITVQDFSSKGRSSRAPGWKTNRTHHFFSDHEKRLFYLYEWSDAVTDIKEQFPLLDLDLAMSIADGMGMKYPIDPHSGTPYVLTTDFILSANQNGKKVEIARTVKPSTELSKKRVAEKLELERRYYAAKGIDWGIVTEQEIPKILAGNIEWIHSAYRLEANTEMDIAELRSLAMILKSRLQENKNTINKVTTALDREMNLESGTSLYLFRHLLARKEILMDMETKISACSSLTAVKRIVF
jgi:hypothetical protein